MKASKRRAKVRTAKRMFDVGYKGQRRVLLRWHNKLKAMRLHARAQGDPQACIELTGICSPGVRYRDGSLWALGLGLAGRQEARALRTGKAPRRIKQRQRPEGMYFGTRQGHSVCLLKSRRKTRFFGAVG